MKCWLYILVSTFAFAGIVHCVGQLVEIVGHRLNFSSQWEYQHAVIGQVIFLVVIILLHIIVFKQIRKQK